MLSQFAIKNGYLFVRTKDETHAINLSRIDSVLSLAHTDRRSRDEKKIRKLKVTYHNGTFTEYFGRSKELFDAVAEAVAGSSGGWLDEENTHRPEWKDEPAYMPIYPSVQQLELSRGIQVKTGGDYRRKWVNATVTEVKISAVDTDEEQRTLYGLSFTVEFDDDGKKREQSIADAFGFSKTEWRYKDEDTEDDVMVETKNEN